MTQQDKELLLKDLCARLPYGVKMLVPSWDEREMEYIDRIDILYSINGDNYVITVNDYYDFCIEDVKPYLFPLSSMTEEQLYNNPIGFAQMLTIKNDGDWENITINRRAYYKLVDWLNAHHFDYRGLIEKGLAIDATNLNIY